jgi:hypothetical protein
VSTWSPATTKRRPRALTCARTRTWTGRAALSRATSTGVPHLVTSGTHRTRVSEMRAGGAAAPPASAPARRALARRAPETPGRG